MWSKIQVFRLSVPKLLLREEVTPQVKTPSYICSPGITVSDGYQLSLLQ